uniref:Uncharacterized protein n=1 Tax=viral metagenome TaxID=1070528 RepID=A0A6C0EXL3_9ZZZZ
MDTQNVLSKLSEQTKRRLFSSGILLIMKEELQTALIDSLSKMTNDDQIIFLNMMITALERKKN